MTTPSRPFHARLAGLPDALTALLFLAVWVAPARMGYEWIEVLLLTKLFEFLVVHSGFIVCLILLSGASRTGKTVAIVIVGTLYLAFAAGSGMAMGESWPLAMFAWLLLSKIAILWLAPIEGDAENHRQMLLWQASLIGYLGAVFATALLPVPELGIDAAAREAGGFGGGELWQAKPQTVIAAGFLYFAWLAYQKSVRLTYAEDLPPINRKGAG